jgi:hypothetical protein
MNIILQNLLAYVVKKLIDAKLYNYLFDAITAQFNNSLTGEEKKAAVKAQLAGLKGALGEIVKSTSGTYLNLAIEAIVAIAKAKFKL